MKKVLILGAPCSGKSTLAFELQKTLDLPVISLDQIYWAPKWQPIELSLFKEKCRKLARRSEWIMEGNFGATLDERLSHADIIIYLDPPTPQLIFRQIFRSLGLLKKVGRPIDCPERFNLQLFWFTLKFRASHGRLIREKVRSQGLEERLLHVTSFNAVKQAMNQITN